ncbi:MAG: hypothetical protein WDA03_05020 [Trueperaceae bacterium]
MADRASVFHRSRLSLTLALTLATALFVALAAQPFASLTVSPAGRQLFDIATGVTTMPDGGVITDQSTGVELSATHIEYLAGAFVEARGARVNGDFGVVTAQSLRLDLQSGVLNASGGLSLARGALTIGAGSLAYYANRQVAVFGGGVVATGPTFEADRLYLDAVTGDVLLVGNYSFSDSLFTMTSPEEGGRLELRMVLRDGEPSYDAATEVRPELLERFDGLL